MNSKGKCKEVKKGGRYGSGESGRKDASKGGKKGK